MNSVTANTMSELEKINADNFLVNVIKNQHKNPARKLQGLLNLLNAGHEVQTGREIDILMIDGCRASWCVLDEWEERTR